MSDLNAFVHSSNVKSIDYSPATKLMTVHFHSGSSYSHSGVAHKDYESLRSSFSPGRYYHLVITKRYPKFTKQNPKK